MNRHTANVLLGAAALALLSWFGLGASGLGIPATYPFPLLIPAFVAVDAFGIWGLSLVVAIIPVIFIAWSIHLFKGATKIPLRSFIFLAVIISLNILYFIYSWSYGVKWQGLTYTVIIAIINVAIASFLLWYGLKSREQQTYFKNYLFHLSMFAWLSYIAFPTLGELP